MTRLDDLPPDQRAVLLLLVQQGKSHAEIAELLGIPERAVRDRAHAGLDALAAGAGETSPPSVTTSVPARSEASSSRDAPRRQPPRGSRAPAPTGARTTRSSSTPAVAPSTLRGPRTPAARSGASRRAGALLLIGLIAVIVVVVLLTSGGGSSNKGASTGATGTSSTAQPHVDKQLNLTSPVPGSNAIGIAEVLSQGQQYAFFVAAEHLPPTSGFFYAAWLYNSSNDAHVLGRAPSVTSNGRLQAVGALPANAARYHQLLITRETATKPTRPGPIVLSGPFSLH
jgi:hypothetical protein